MSNAPRLYWSAETPRWRKTIWRESMQLKNDRFCGNYPSRCADPGFFLGEGVPLRNDFTARWGKQILKAKYEESFISGRSAHPLHPPPRSAPETPGTDGLTSVFYRYFWNAVNKFMADSFNYALQHGSFSICQRQGVISLIPKKNKNAEYLTNWRPVLLLYVHYKITSKTLALR